jgi:hypothetical protein
MLLGFLCAYLGYLYAQPFVQWEAGEGVLNIRVQPLTGDERDRFETRFAAMCGLVGVCAVAAAVISTSVLTLTSLIWRTGLFLLIAILTFACAAFFFRQECSRLNDQLTRRPEVRLDISAVDLPSMRVPLISAALALTGGALMRAVVFRFENVRAR